MRRLMLLVVLVGAVVALSADTASAGWRKRCCCYASCCQASCCPTTNCCPATTRCCGATGYWGGSGYWSRTCGWWGAGNGPGLAYNSAPAAYVAYQVPIATCASCRY